MKFKAETNQALDALRARSHSSREKELDSSLRAFTFCIWSMGMLCGTLIAGVPSDMLVNKLKDSLAQCVANKERRGAEAFGKDASKVPGCEQLRKCLVE